MTMKTSSITELTTEEERVIEALRKTPWGEIRIKMRGGRPVMLSVTEDTKLDDNK